MADERQYEYVSVELPSDKPQVGGCLKSFFGLIVFCVVATVLFSSCGGSDSSSDEPSDFEAQAQCERWVENYLKAPSTVEFSGQSVSGGPVSWTVTGVVDAENSFGGMVRSA